MDLYKAIRELIQERERIQKIIVSLEEIIAKGNKIAPNHKTKLNPPTSNRRGRKSMSAEERRQVSERMARYWANKRSAKGEGPPPTS